MRVAIVITVAFVGCTKAANAVEFGEPIGIEITGANVMVAVAAEHGHEIAAASIPELATALASVKQCAVTGLASVHAAVKDGVISAPPDSKQDAASACVARAIDGKPVKSLSSSKLLVQVAPAKK